MKIKEVFRKVFLFGLAVSLVSIFLTLLVGEFVVKHILPQETYKLARMVGLYIFEGSNIIPYTLKKNVNKFNHISFTREFTHLISTNSLGTRGKEFSLDKPADTYRILFLGDSMTFGWGVEDESAYPALVEKALNPALITNGKYKRVETINAGFTDANAPDTYYLYYKEVASKFKPDLVVVSLFPYNDLSDMYYHSWDKVDSRGYPLKISSKIQKVVDGYLVSREKNNWKFELPIVKNSHLGMLLANALERGAPNVVNSIKKLEGIRENKQPFENEDVKKCVYAAEEKQCPPELWPYFEKVKFILKGMKELADSNKQEEIFTIMASPDQAVPLSEKQERLTILPSIKPQKYFRDFFAQEKMTALDLLPAFSIPGAQRFFYKQDGHLDSEGHKLAASQISAFIQKTKPDIFSPPPEEK